MRASPAIAAVKCAAAAFTVRTQHKIAFDPSGYRASSALCRAGWPSRRACSGDQAASESNS
jgi:hypothetical protein